MIKYNDRGEVVSVNGITTGHHIGKPMQDAIGTPQDNEAYGRELGIVSNVTTKYDDYNPPNVGKGGASHWDDLEGKPFGDKVVVEEILVGETTFESDGETSAFISLTLSDYVKDGDSCIVTFDGVKYECVVSRPEGDLVIGNEDLRSGLPADGKEPFCMKENMYNTSQTYLWADDAGTHTFTIGKLEEGTTTIPKELLPEPLRFGTKSFGYDLTEDEIWALEQVEGWKQGDPFDGGNLSLFLFRYSDLPDFEITSNMLRNAQIKMNYELDGAIEVEEFKNDNGDIVLYRMLYTNCHPGVLVVLSSLEYSNGVLTPGIYIEQGTYSTFITSFHIGEITPINEKYLPSVTFFYTGENTFGCTHTYSEIRKALLNNHLDINFQFGSGGMTLLSKAFMAGDATEEMLMFNFLTPNGDQMFLTMNSADEIMLD